MSSDSIDMIRRCFYHQKPAEFGRPDVDYPFLDPAIFSRGEDLSGIAYVPEIPEEPMGCPEAQPW